MTTTTLTREIADFAASVRLALADLPPEELDDLTDGLEADLAERAADDGAELGDPVTYAEELRAAAGYPPRAARSHLGGALPNLRTLPQELRRRAAAFRDAHPSVGAVTAFLVTLRPVWWVLRGWAVYALFAAFLGFNAALPSNPIGWLLLLALVVLSVQWGRGKWMPWPWMRRGLIVASVILAVALPFLVNWAIASVQNQYWNDYSQTSVQPSYTGLTESGGQPVTNIFAYDAQGNPIDQVQLFDQDGKPLNAVNQTDLAYSDVYPDATGNGGYVLVPNDNVPGRPGWNVYPLGQVDYNALADGELPANVHVTTPTTPFDFVKPLSGSEATPESTPAPSPTPSSAP